VTADGPPIESVLSLAPGHFLATEPVVPRLASPDVRGIATMQVTVPNGFPAIPESHLPIEVAVHPGGRVGGGSLRGNGGGAHDQQGRHEGKERETHDFLQQVGCWPRREDAGVHDLLSR
jgi:hypothetical protein